MHRIGRRVPGAVPHLIAGPCESRTVGLYNHCVLAGLGLFESLTLTGLLTTTSLLYKRAAHVLCEGVIVFERSSFTDADEQEVEGEHSGGLQWLVAVGSSAKLVLIDTNFSSKIRDQGMLKLIADAEVVLRRCRAENVTVAAGGAEGKLGIVNCTFEPALVDANLTVHPPKCDMLLAGRGPMCDPRAI